MEERIRMERGIWKEDLLIYWENWVKDEERKMD
jgi:hypothetical protein